MKVVLPEPEGPTRKTNSPLSISTEKSPRATVEPLYVLVTFSNLIMRAGVTAWIAMCGACGMYGPALPFRPMLPRRHRPVSVQPL